VREEEEQTPRLRFGLVKAKSRREKTHSESGGTHERERHDSADLIVGVRGVWFDQSL